MQYEEALIALSDTPNEPKKKHLLGQIVSIIISSQVFIRR
jgi:hypothetical protein